MAAASVVAFLMTAAVSLSVVVPAFMTFSVVVPMVVTLGIGIIFQSALDQCFGCFVRRTRYAAVEFDARFGQRILSAHADAAAEQGVHLRDFQEACQCAVPAAVSGHNLFLDDFTVLHIIELELLRVTEVLENLSVFISYRNSHCF